MINPLIKYPLIILIIGLLGWFLFKIIKENGELEVKLESSVKVEEINKEIREKKDALEHETKTLTRDSIVRGMCHYGWVRSQDGCPNK